MTSSSDSKGDMSDGRATADPVIVLGMDVGATSAEYESRQSYLQGARLHFTTAAICMVLFLSNLEIPVVTTALVGISDDLGGFRKASWVTTSYLLGYAAFIIIFAKISDVFGRKSMLLLTTVAFCIFSGACGAAQTMDQLIIFRAFQGLGGSGDFALCSVIILDLVPSHKYAEYSSNISIVYAISLCVGPIIGGAIIENSTWRWIFLLK
ncbi:hypothetical protein VMCG_10813 [Cytospora schulzeri]|uniref:Major facilitator superfamily (MFS) profile domain-containing protein n=1 Tax=Cytospora schulzeri TaxID=448051 RepID=A0A423V7T7_9PEZI|nr:hypothetical protein VMCG_10813 [Valsa malicola]